MHSIFFLITKNKGMKSYILLENIEFYAHHGVFEQETLVGNIFIVNIKIKTDLSDATLSDQLDDTINYGSIYKIIKDEMSIPSKLLEHAGGRIIRALKANFHQIESIELKISKRNPPMGGQIEYASVLLID